jgi:hypothetical protein
MRGEERDTHPSSLILHPFSRMFQSIKKIIPQSLQASGIERQVSASFVVDEARHALERLWGAERASYIELLGFSNGILMIRITSPSAAQMLRTVETAWMNEANRSIGERKIIKIDVKR